MTCKCKVCGRGHGRKSFLNLCRLCVRSYDRDLAKDSTVAGAIAWAATRARRFAEIKIMHEVLTVLRASSRTDPNGLTDGPFMLALRMKKGLAQRNKTPDPPVEGVGSGGDRPGTERRRGLSGPSRDQ